VEALLYYYGDDRARGCGNFRGEVRQIGHEAFSGSHSSMHCAWKQCPHSGMLFTVSFGMYSDRHIEHVFSLFFGNRLFSPMTIFGYDSIVGLSRPDTDVGLEPARASKSATVSWAQGPSWFLILSQLQMQLNTPKEHNIAGTPMHMAMA